MLCNGPGMPPTEQRHNAMLRYAALRSAHMLPIGLHPPCPDLDGPGLGHHL